MNDAINTVSGVMAMIMQSSDMEQYICEYLYDRESVNAVKYLFEHAGLRWNAIVEDDIERALSGRQLQYFVCRESFADDARDEMGLPKLQLYQPSFMSWKESIDLCDHMLQMGWYEVENYGINISFHLGNDWACPREQNAFYKTDAWRRCSALARYQNDYECKRCHVRGPGLHVHHCMPIQSGFGTTFDSNFADWKLSVYCKDCHESYHKHAVRTMGPMEYSMESEEMAREDKRQISKAWELIHALNLCEYCNSKKEVHA